MLSVLKSRLAFVAYFLIAVKPVWSLVSFFGNVDFLIGYLAPIGNFLATGWGTLVLIVSGFSLLFYVVYKQQTESQTAGKGLPESQPSGEAQKQLEERLREVEQERDELRAENEGIIAEAESGSQPAYLPDTLEEWLKTTPLTTIPNQTYRNDRIELDGFFYERCTFQDCTFSFRGTKPFRVSADCTVKGMVNIDARGPQLQAMLVFMKQLGALHPNSQWYDFYDGRLID